MNALSNLFLLISAHLRILSCLYSIFMPILQCAGTPANFIRHPPSSTLQVVNKNIELYWTQSGPLRDLSDTFTQCSIELSVTTSCARFVLTSSVSKLFILWHFHLIHPFKTFLLAQVSTNFFFFKVLSLSSWRKDWIIISHDLFLTNSCYLLLVFLFLSGLHWSLSTASHIVLAVHCNDSVANLLIYCLLESCYSLHTALLHFLKILVFNRLLK